jgi:hypothetical protein
MAPKKSKKTADSINSRLALVMKSGKGAIPSTLNFDYDEFLIILQSHWAQSQHSRVSDPARPSSLL